MHVVHAASACFSSTSSHVLSTTDRGRRGRERREPNFEATHSSNNNKSPFLLTYLFVVFFVSIFCVYILFSALHSTSNPLRYINPTTTTMRKRQTRFGAAHSNLIFNLPSHISSKIKRQNLKKKTYSFSHSLHFACALKHKTKPQSAALLFCGFRFWWLGWSEEKERVWMKHMQRDATNRLR